MISKKESNYREKDEHNCGTCRYMHADGGCDKVIGKVDRQHVCDLWEQWKAEKRR